MQARSYEPGIRDDVYDYREAFGGGVGDEAWELERTRGAIPISDHGCGMTSWLITVGPHRGELRFRDCAFNPPSTRTWMRTETVTPSTPGTSNGLSGAR